MYVVQISIKSFWIKMWGTWRPHHLCIYMWFAGAEWCSEEETICYGSNKAKFHNFIINTVAKIPSYSRGLTPLDKSGSNTYFTAEGWEILGGPAPGREARDPRRRPRAVIRKGHGAGAASVLGANYCWNSTTPDSPNCPMKSGQTISTGIEPHSSAYPAVSGLYLPPQHPSTVESVADWRLCSVSW